MRRPWTLLLVLVALGATFALAACGGGSERRSNERLIPRAIATELAAKADAVAEAYDPNDPCPAAGLADELKDAVDAAVAGGQIPPRFQRELAETATELQNEIDCPPPVEEGEDHGNGKGEDKGKGNKKGHEDETTTIGTTIETTTEED